MELIQNEWIGAWINFESYIYSDNPYMIRCWEEAEQVAKNIPMFKGSAKSFWAMACNTINEENAIRLSGWKIRKSGEGLEIQWIGENSESLGKQHYELKEIVSKGLEAKENFLFEAVDAPQGWPFRYLLAMAPMPERSAKDTGGLLSHLHFQYASSTEKLMENGKLENPLWYATMCVCEGTLLDRCNIIRALHRLPVWTELPVTL